MGSRLDDLEKRVPVPVVELPDAWQPSAGAAAHAYCPIIVRNCGDVRCRQCKAFLDHFDGQILWFCAVCADLHPADARRGFWSDGSCDGCGFESSVLSAFEFE